MTPSRFHSFATPLERHEGDHVASSRHRHPRPRIKAPSAPFGAALPPHRAVLALLLLLADTANAFQFTVSFGRNWTMACGESTWSGEGLFTDQLPASVGSSCSLRFTVTDDLAMVISSGPSAAPPPARRRAVTPSPRASDTVRAVLHGPRRAPQPRANDAVGDAPPPEPPPLPGCQRHRGRRTMLRALRCLELPR